MSGYFFVLYTTTWYIKTIRALHLLLLLGATPAIAGRVCYTPDPSDGMDAWFGSVYYQGGMPNSDQVRLGGWGDTYATLLRFNLSGLPAKRRKPTCGSTRFLREIPPPSIGGCRSGLGRRRPLAFITNRRSVAPCWAPRRHPRRLPGMVLISPGLYNGWRAVTGYPNFGLKMMPANTNNTLDTFYSSDYTGNVSLRPTLCVNSTSTESRIVLKWPLAISTRVGWLIKDLTYLGQLAQHVMASLRYTIGSTMLHLREQLCMPLKMGG
jgi:hypothetical protein